jgi:lysophospholipase L1-like esterase
MNYYDPYQNQCSSNPTVLQDLELFNQHLANDAASEGVPVADVFTAFGGATTPNPNLCAETWMCSSYHDIHPTSSGYSSIASAFETTAGY